MRVKQRLANGRMPTTAQGLKQVTTNFVLVLSQAGQEAGSIRRSVMQVAMKVIQSLAVDEYQLETHTAIVQRSLEAALRKLGMAEGPRVT